MDQKIKNPNILEANYFYLFIAIVFLSFAKIAKNLNFASITIIVEYGILLVPTVLFIKIRGYSLKKVLRLNKLSLKQIILVPIITVFAYPIGVFVNYLMIIILSLFGKVKPNIIPIPETSGEFLISLFLIAITAGICEEVVFRGLMLKSYEKLGKKQAILISGIMFGLFHFNLQNLFGPIFLGILFGYILYKTDSIFSTMLAHATNNAIALSLGVIMKKLLSNVEKVVDLSPEASAKSIEQLNNMPQIAQIIAYLPGLIFVGFFAVIGATVVYFLLKYLPNKNERTEDVLLLKDEGIKIKDYFNGMSFTKIIVIILPLIISGILFIRQGYFFIIS